MEDRISSNQQYKSLALTQKRISLWMIEGLLSGDLIAGLVAGINVMFSYIFAQGQQYNGETIVVTKLDGSMIYNPMLGNHIATTMMAIPLDFNKYSPDPELYGWWIKGENKYTLYQFETMDFIQGFISACDIFEVDFRDYIIGLPFKVENKVKVDYIIEGYDIEPFTGTRIPAPMGPFYTGGFEDDPDAVDFD